MSSEKKGSVVIEKLSNAMMKVKKGNLQKLVHIFVILLFFIVFVSVFYNFGDRDYKTESAILRESTASDVIDGIFLRNETVIKYNGQGVVSYSVADGGRLGKGSVIAEIYSSSSHIQINQQIQALEEELELLKKIQNPGTIESAQPSSLSDLIEEKYRNLAYYRDIKDYEKVEEKEEELLIYMSTYQLLTNSEVNFADHIAEITAEINQLKKSASAPSEVITADNSAYFASFCDGYEDELTKESIDSLTIDYLKSLKDVNESALTSGNVIGKLIDNYEWYMAGIVDNTNKIYEAGDTLKIKTESSPTEYSAVVVDIRDEGNPAESILIISSNEFNYDLVQHRIERTEIIKGKYKGLKVPRKAIRFKNITETVEDENGMEIEVTENCKGVYILQGEQVVFRKLDVIYEGDDYILSAINEDDSNYLALYDDIIVEGVDSDGN